MTYQQFLAKLRETTRTRKWRVQRNGCIRSRACCPITAIAPRARHAEHAYDIGRALKIRPSVRDTVIDAADHWSYLTTHERRVRRDLLAACGLPEDA